MAVTGSRAVLGGRYVLGELLGTGGMAAVWRASDLVLDRPVAVKVLSPQLAADAGFAARFEREARHAARLAHPRLVTVFDCGTDNGRPFIVMELVEGRTLRQVLDQAGPLPPGQAVAIAVQVCEALEVAHAAGLVHRDVKPANIVLPGGEVKVLDFGIARADGLSGGTRTLGVLGTAAYLSPEQASGGPAGPQSDLYSLGCVLFEMLTGAPPFAADSAVGLAYQHVHGDPGLPSARRAGLPARLDAITARLLAKDPAGRPAGAAAARAGLLAALNPDATDVLTPVGGHVSPGYRRRRRMTRAEVVLAVALGAAVATLAGVLVTGAARHGAPAARPPGHAVTRPGASAHRAAHPGRARHHTPGLLSGLPPVAAAAAVFVGDLQAGVADGQVTSQAGQDLYNHLQQLLLGPPVQSSQQIQQRYAQLTQAYQQHRAHGDITGHAATALGHALAALGTAIGAHG
jgi:hypothetical protein